MSFIRPLRFAAAFLLPALGCLAALPAVAARTQSANVLPLVTLSDPQADLLAAPRGVRGDLLLGADGQIYFGSLAGGEGSGTISRVGADGVLSLVHALKADGSEGISIYGGLTQGFDGNFYGTAFGGGTSGSGTVFRVSPAGEFSVLRAFGGALGEPVYPYTGVVQGPDAMLYGTTLRGGAYDKGTIFRMGTDGSNFTVLHQFRGSNGDKPEGKLALGSDGLLYGTTAKGGDQDGGTVYRVAPDGDFQLLYSFPRLGELSNQGRATNATGANPRAGLMFSSLDGNFYGTAYQGGRTGYGTLFRMTPGGIVSVVHAFEGPLSGKGASPLAGVTQDAAGNFYGTTQAGGFRSQGAAYRIGADGHFTLLHSFVSSPLDGLYPHAGLLPAHGTIYGATVQDGPDGGAGVIVKLDEGINGALPVDLQATSLQVAQGDAITLNWTAPNNALCTKVQGPASWSGEAPRIGSQRLLLDAGRHTFGLSCTEPDDGETATPLTMRAAYVTVAVQAPALIPVDSGGTGSLSSSWLLLFAALLLFKVKKESEAPCP